MNPKLCRHCLAELIFLFLRALERMDSELEKLYSGTGRPSTAP